MKQWQDEAYGFFRKAGLVITPTEHSNIEIADFGLSEFARSGLGVLVYVNTARCCAKELAMWPRQTCPEHRHPPVKDNPGKEETFRCRWGSVYLYVEGTPAAKPHCRPPKGRESTYTVWHEVVLRPGDQYTIMPNTKHWFQAGDEGAVVSEFSTRSTDENDIFTDPDIGRATKVV
ncbi:MAG: D-lyxose/D-mannose family sugar isomerase [Verrucomicrobia bacterium]|nr:D-lyxose/D-mannose family sugar isomerase [Verrucomicrobiota bacterium]